MCQIVIMNLDRAAVCLAVRQGGVIRHDQAYACGFTKGQIDQRVRDGRWKPVGHFGYRVIEMAGFEDRLRAAVTSLPLAVVSHEAAAQIHGLPKVQRGKSTVLVHSRTTHDFPEVIVRRCHDLLEEHVVKEIDLPVTSIARTIVDLAPHVSQRHLSSILASLIVERRVRTDDVWAVVDQVARRGKPGIAKMRAVLAERDEGPRDGTPLERLGASVLRDFGLPEPRFEYPMPWKLERRFDAAYPGAKLAIEWDSRRWHDDPDAFERDRRRDREALLHGWKVVRFTWRDLTERPGEVADTVRRLLAEA
jgi:very-short-patch-repair endonuclease